MIRRANAEDIPAIVALQQDISAEQAIWGYRADSPEEWAKRDLRWSYMAFHDGEPAGFIHCLPRPHAGECVFSPDSRILEVAEIAVAAKLRCHGLGHELVSVVQQQAKAEGFTHLRVYSAAKKFDAVLKFYRSCGFTPWYVELTNATTAGSPTAE